MPTSQIHEIVSRKIAINNDLDNYEFYLGSIAPDSVNVDGFADKELRWYSHLRSKNLNEWKENAISLYNRNKDKYPIGFIKGYVTHLITDIIYDEKYYMSVVEPMKQDNLYNHEAHLYMLDEMMAYGKNNKDFNYVLNILKDNNKLYTIRNINEELLYRWKNKIINEELPNIEVKYINEEMINNLTKDVEEYLKLNNIL